MEEKTYLKWYNKIGYGSGDIAGNVVYALLASFVIAYTTTTMGMNAGIVGSLIALSKLFDGITDIFFGHLIDRTKSKMGKARPWMLYGYIGCAVMLVAVFAIPTSLGEFAKYAWFFIAYTVLHAVFFTANNIAYSALTSLVTVNNKERVQLGSCRFIFAFSTSLLIQSVTLVFVRKMGGDAAAWRTVAIIYATIGLIVNTISVMSVKELPEEERCKVHTEEKENSSCSFVETAKLILSNKYYLRICAVYLLQQIYTAMISQGLFYAKFILGNEDLFAVFAWAINIPLIISLLITPFMVTRFKGMYKLNLTGFAVASVGRLLVLIAAYMGNIPLMMVFTAFAAFGMGPWQGDMNAVIAECSEYTYLTKQKHVEGSMYSCTSLGLKLGGGLGIALTGWLLEWSGFVGTSAVQSESCLRMLRVMYLWLPFFILLLITFIMSILNVEKANKALKEGLA